MILVPSRQAGAAARLPALVVAAWIGMAGCAAFGRPSDPVDTMAKVARDLDLQTQMPKDEPPKQDPPSDIHWHIPGDLAQWILFGALAVGLGFVAYALRDTLPSLSRRTRVNPDVAVVLPNAAVLERMQEAGGDADELARQGRFAEAMHMLLLRSLSELRKRLDVTIADSLTSREILRGLTLPERGRGALADLIQRVEFVHFGRRIPVPEDYGACRASFDELIATMLIPAATPA